MSKELEAILKSLRTNLPELRDDFAVDSLAVFGSTARDQARPDSDIDVLVTFTKTPGLLGFLALEEHLATLVDRPVDLVMESALQPRIRERVLTEAIAA